MEMKSNYHGTIFLFLILHSKFPTRGAAAQDFNCRPDSEPVFKQSCSSVVLIPHMTMKTLIAPSERKRLVILLDEHKEKFGQGANQRSEGFACVSRDFLQEHRHYEAALTTKQIGRMCSRIITAHSVVEGSDKEKWQAFSRNGKASLTEPYGPTGRRDAVSSGREGAGTNGVPAESDHLAAVETERRGTFIRPSRKVKPRYREPSSTEERTESPEASEKPTKPQRRLDQNNEQIQESSALHSQQRRPLEDGEISGRMRELKIAILDIAKQFASKHPRRKYGLDGTSLLAQTLSINLSSEGLQSHESLISLRTIISGAVSTWVLKTDLATIDISFDSLRRVISSKGVYSSAIRRKGSID